VARVKLPSLYGFGYSFVGAADLLVPTKALLEGKTQTEQNTRRSLVASINKIYDAGMFVHAGFIVGFDSEKKSVRTR